MSQEVVIDVRNLRSTDGDFAAVKDISFQVPAGHVFALLGTNGAGKTTTMARITVGPINRRFVGGGRHGSTEPARRPLEDPHTGRLWQG